MLLQCNPEMMIECVSIAGTKAIAISASLAGIYAFWMGVVKIVENTPAISKLEKALYPIISRIFPETTSEIRKLICLNVSANFLGAGGAATPIAISAINKMKPKNNKKIAQATKPMLMLFILNATSLQLIPTTVISLRQKAGSIAPSNILLPATLASVVSTVVGVVVVWWIIDNKKNVGADSCVDPC